MPLINTYVLSMPGYFLHIILVWAYGSHGWDWDQMPMPTLLDPVADTVVLADIGSVVWWADADVLASRDANEPANSLAPSKLVHCKHSLDQMSWYNIAYLCVVKWSGYTKDHNTWEPEENCKNSCDLIDDFHKKNPFTLRKLCTNIFAGLVFKPYENLMEPNKTTLSRLEVKT